MRPDSGTSLIAKRQIWTIFVLGLLNLVLAAVVLAYTGRWPFNSDGGAQTQHTTTFEPLIPPPPVTTLVSAAPLPEVVDHSKVEPIRPDGFISLIAWFDASSLRLAHNAPIAQWKELSRRGIIAKQSDAQRQPVYRTRALNGLPIVDFNGVTSFLEASDVAKVLRSSPTATVIYVSKTRADKPQYVINFTGPGKLNDIARAGYAGRGNLRIKFDTRVGSWSDSSRVETKNFAIYSAVYSDKVAEMYQNAQLRISSMLLAPVPFSYAELCSIGQEWDDSGPSDFFDGELAELAVFSGALSKSDRLSVEKYLSDKYNIPLE